MFVQAYNVCANIFLFPLSINLFNIYYINKTTIVSHFYLYLPRVKA